MKELGKNIFIALIVALIVFFLFYNCTGKQEEHTAAQKDSTAAASGSVSPYSSDCKKLYENATRMDSILLASTEVNRDDGNKAIKAFSDFSSYCSNDTLAPVFLIKAAQVAQSINNLPQAQVSLEKCIKDFPNFRDRGAAMFLLAQLYDDPHYLNNDDRAFEIYSQIISLYPNTVWAANASAARDLSTKSDEQIIKEFEKKNKKK